MKNTRHNFADAMDAAKVTAQTARNRGQSTGKAAKGWVRSRAHHTPAKGSWDRLLTDTQARWHHAAGTAVNDYLWAVNPSRDDLEQFIRDGGAL